MIKTATQKTLIAAAVLALALPATVAGAAGAPPESIAPAAAQSPTVEGTWSTRARERDDGRQRIQLSLEIDRDDRGTWNTGFAIDGDEFEGLSFEQARGSVDDARFRMVRDAGTVAFEGVIRNGRGAGTFSFVPNQGWIGEMAALGFDELSETEVFQGAIHDITTAYVGELRDLGYTELSEGQLFSFAIHGVTAEFIRELNDLGYDDIRAGQLTQLRIHGVTPEYVREVRRAMGG